jgi:hypothetical protein
MIGLKVFIYFNLHKNCWSVRHNGKVIAHVDSIALTNVTFKVSKAGRARVLATKHKNVHAGVFGEVVPMSFVQALYDWTPVTYNPYKYETFVQKSDQKPVYHAETVTMGILKRLDATNVPLVLARLG